DELSKLYSSKCKHATCDLTAPLEFADYANQQARQIGGPEATKVEAYWLTKFSSLPPRLELPTDRPRAALKSYRGATYRSTIPAESYRKIKRAGAQRGCTLFVPLRGGFDALLHRLTSQEEIVVGIPAAGQSSVEGSTLVGHCVNFLPLREKITATHTGMVLLSHVTPTVLDASDHLHYPP